MGVLWTYRSCFSPSREAAPILFRLNPREEEKGKGGRMCCLGPACCCDCLCACTRGYVRLMTDLPPVGRAVLLGATVGLLGVVGFGLGLLVNHLSKWYYGDFE